MLRKKWESIVDRSGPRRPGKTSREDRVRNRVILKSLLLGALAVDAVLVLLLVYTLVGRIPYFNLQQVDINGNRHLSRAEVIETSEIEAGTNLLLVDLGAIAEKLERHPWIRSASVFRRFPGRIIIEIKEPSPRAVLAAGKLYYVDEQAEIFYRLLPGDSVRYPLLTTENPGELESKGAQIREMVRKGMGLLELVERRGSGMSATGIAEIRMDLDDGLTVQQKSGRLVILGKKDFESKIERYGRLKRFLSKRGKWNQARV